MLGQCLAMWPCSWHWKQCSSSFDIMLTIDGWVMVAVSCCTALSFLTSEIVLLSICGPLSYMCMARLWTLFKPWMNIQIVAASFIKLHLLASVLNQCTYTVRDSFSHCCTSMNHVIYVWISALQSFSHNRSLMSSQDLFEVMASVTNVCIKPYVFTLASLAVLSLVRSAAISMSVIQSSNLVESCSLKTGISCRKEFVRLDSFCVEHKVSVYCCSTFLRGSAGAGGCGWWMASDKFWCSHCMWSRVSAGCPSPAATLWHKSLISDVSAVNLSWLLYTGSSGCPTASGPPRAAVASKLWVL